MSQQQFENKPFDLNAFLKEKLASVEVTEDQGPKGSIKEGESLVAEMDNELQRVYCLSNSYDKRLREIGEVQEGDEQFAEYMFSKYVSEFLKKYFWLQVNARFALWNVPALGVREGWQIVSYQEEPCSGGIAALLGLALAVRG